MGLRLSDSERQRARLDEIARREGRSLADLIREAVDDYLDHSDPNIPQALEATFGRVPDLVIPDRHQWERRLG